MKGWYRKLLPLVSTDESASHHPRKRSSRFVQPSGGIFASFDEPVADESSASDQSDVEDESSDGELPPPIDLQLMEVSNNNKMRLFLGTEMRFELECLVVDISRAYAAVTSVWVDAKVGRTSIMTAATLTSTSTGLVDAAYQAFVQSNKSTVQNVEDFLNCIRELLPGPCTNPRLLWLRRCTAAAGPLLSFKEVIWKKGRHIETSLLVRDGHFGPLLFEDSSPLLVGPPELASVCVDPERLLLYELPRIFNIFLKMKKIAREEGRGSTLPVLAEHRPCCFFSHCIRYFESGTVDFPFVFACACWLESVLRTQGDGFMARCGALTKLHAQTLLKIYAACGDDQASGDPADKWVFDRELNHRLEVEKVHLTHTFQQGELYNRNPWAAGAAIVRMSCHNMFFGIGVLNNSLRLRTVAHTYYMLREQGALADPIHQLEQVLCALGDKAIFPIGRGCAGKYFQTFMMSANMTAAGAAQMSKPGTPPPVRLATTKKRKGQSVYEVLTHSRLLCGALAKSGADDHHSTYSLGSELAEARRLLEEEHSLQILGLDGIALHALCGTTLHAILGVLWPGLSDQLGAQAAERNNKDHDLWCLDEVVHQELLLKVDSELNQTGRLSSSLTTRLKEAGSAMLHTWETHYSSLLLLPASADWHGEEFGLQAKSEEKPLGKGTASVEIQRRAVAIAAHDPIAHCNLCIALAECGEDLTDLQEAVRVWSEWDTANYCDAYFILYLAQKAKGADDTEAEATLRKILARDIDYEPVTTSNTEPHGLVRKNLLPALVRKFCPGKESYIPVKFAMAVFESVGDSDDVKLLVDAVVALEHAAEQSDDPRVPPESRQFVGSMLGRVYESLEMPERALQVFREAVVARPDMMNGLPLNSVARLCAQLGVDDVFRAITAEHGEEMLPLKNGEKPVQGNMAVGPGFVSIIDAARASALCTKLFPSAGSFRATAHIFKDMVIRYAAMIGQPAPVIVPGVDRVDDASAALNKINLADDIAKPQSWYVFMEKTANKACIMGDDGFDVDTDAFGEAMDVLEEATGPLTEASKDQFKGYLRGRPKACTQHSIGAHNVPLTGDRAADFAMMKRSQQQVSRSMHPDELGTLIHQLAAGPAADSLLLDWTLHAGASAIYHNGRINARGDNDGVTAAHVAAGVGNFECFRTLWQYAGNCAHLRDKKGMFPLHYAAAGGHSDMCELLISTCGADPRASDRSGKKASTLAREASEKAEDPAVLKALARNLKLKEASTDAEWQRINSHVDRTQEMHAESRERRADLASRLVDEQLKGASGGKLPSAKSNNNKKKKGGKKKKK
jgi:hypothetical protein